MATRQRALRRLQVGTFIGLMIGILITGTLLSGGLRQFESRISDFFRRPIKSSDQIVLVAIDDKTVGEIGWPIERPLYGAFLFALMRAEPRVIAIDFLLPDPKAEEEDTFVSTILLRAKNIVQPVLGIETTRFPARVGTFPAFDSMLGPAPVLRTTNTNLAHNMLYSDSDGVVRRVPLAINVQGKQYPALGLAALALHQGFATTLEISDNQVLLGDLQVPVNETGQVALNYVQRTTLPVVSYIDVVQGKADPKLLRDRIVLVGPTTKAIHESYEIPVIASDSEAYNVEIQADLIETLLGRKFLRQQDQYAQIGEIILIALIAGATLPHLTWLLATGLALVYASLYWVYGFQQADNGILVTPLYSALALVLIYALAMLYRYFSEERARSFVGRMFLGLVPPGATEQVIALFDRGALSLRGGRREVTVLHARLRGLASLSEAMAPESVVDLMNRYVLLVNGVVFRHGGSVHHQAGDLFVAMWNFPLTQPDHAIRAVDAALEILADVNSSDSHNPTNPRVTISVGVATGPAVAGYLSASARADYSVVGDVVNIAERLSALAISSPIRLDSATQQLLDQDFETRVVHSFRMQGIKDSLLVWEAHRIVRATALS